MSRFEQVFGQMPFELSSYIFMEKFSESNNHSLFRVLHASSRTEFIARVIDLESPMWQDRSKDVDASLAKMNNLDHTSLTRIYGNFKQKGFLVLILGDFVSTYDKHLDGNGPLKATDASIVILFVLEALNYIHKQNVPHMGVRPGNIRIDIFNRAVLSEIDFGTISENSNDLTYRGSLAFQAPEVLAGNCTDYFKADIWSLGITFYSLLTGQVPWPKTNPDAMKQAIMKPKIMLPTSLGPDVQRIILLMLNRDPNKRASSQQLIEDQFFKQVQAKRTKEVSRSKLTKSRSGVSKETSSSSSLHKMHSFKMGNPKASAKKVLTATGHYDNSE